jgi:asparagine synthase (glutamine-hydrolysing)
MCGIAGVFHRRAGIGAEVLDRTVAKMIATMVHRGPDDEGTWSEPAAGIALGQRRLAVIDLSPAGRQPMVSTCGRYVLVYNGEIYNYRELAAELGAAGRRVQGGSDTAVLLEACAAWGVTRAIERAVGMFAFALFDRQERSLTLARDRLGIKPLYWTQTGDTFLFGSELKALRAYRGLGAAIDPAALAAYLRFAYVPAPASIYRNIQKLRPGHILTIPAEGDASVDCYWDLKSFARNGQANPSEESLDDLHELIRDAVRCRLVADVPLGAFLSGGVDSSTVVALMQSEATRPVKTFSIGFHEEEYDESAQAKAVAEHLGTEHVELFVTSREALDSIEELPRWFDEPFADSSQIPTLLLSRLTREHVTVAISGDGGDEVFGGYNRYVWLPRLWKATGRWPQPVRSAASWALQALSPDAWDSLGRAVPRGRRPRQLGDKIWKAASALTARDIDASYYRIVSHWPNATELVPGSQQTNEGMESPSLSRDLSDPVARMQLLDMITYLPDDILTKVDRASMASSLEARVPLLDHRLVEFAWRLPRASLFANGQTKAPLRRILDRYVPRALIERPKSGFAVPINSWLRGPLRDWAEDLLSEKALADDGLLDPRPIRTAWAEHLSRRRNHQHALWCVLMFQAWRRES